MVEQTVSVLLVASAIVLGFLAMRRSRDWNYWSQYVAAASIVLLVVIATSNHGTEQIVQPVHEPTGQTFAIARESEIKLFEGFLARKKEFTDGQAQEN